MGSKGIKSGNSTKSPNKVVKRDLDSNLDIEDNNSVDMEVLNALPASIRAEVEAQMKSNAAIAKLKAKSVSSKQQASTSRGLFEDSNSNSESARVPPPGTNVEKEPNNEIVATSQESEKNGPPSFCGKTSVSEIRPLLKEWITSATAPLYEDVQMLAEFFKDLIKNWRIDLVQILLKCLFRNIGKLDPDSASLWREAWENLVQKIQTVMIQNYGNPLY